MGIFYKYLSECIVEALDHNTTISMYDGFEETRNQQWRMSGQGAEDGGQFHVWGYPEYCPHQLHVSRII